MVRRELLPVVILCGLLFALIPASAATASPCTGYKFRGGLCSTTGRSNGGGVDVGTHVRIPGRGGRDPGRLIGGGGSFSRDPNAPVAICSERSLILPCRPRKGGAPSVSLSDLKHFVPRSGIDHMQPDGWMVVGLSTNFYATVPSELERGRLLGREARVRFVPVVWHWVYGDGSGATRATPGATWAAQGLHDFDPTSTGHVFAKRGPVDIGLVVSFGAEYEYAGSGWIPIEGTIDVPANRLKATAGTAKTVLVGRDCNANPDGPGC